MTKYLITGLLIIGIAATILPAFAAGPAPRTGPGSGGSTSVIPPGKAITLDIIKDVIIRIVLFALWAGGFIVTGAVIVSGVIYVTAGSDTTRIDLAKTMFWNSVKGAAIIFGVGAILWTIDGLITGDFFFYGGY